MKWTDFMKIYYFDAETGIYQGEGFADESPLRRGVFRMPDNATTIVPPTYEPGIEVPFFDHDLKEWVLRKVRRGNNNLSEA